MMMMMINTLNIVIIIISVKHNYLEEEEDNRVEIIVCTCIHMFLCVFISQQIFDSFHS